MVITELSSGKINLKNQNSTKPKIYWHNIKNILRSSKNEMKYQTF